MPFILQLLFLRCVGYATINQSVTYLHQVAGHIHTDPVCHLVLSPPPGGIVIRRVCLFVVLFIGWFVRSLTFLLPNISKTVGGRNSVQMDHQYKMANGESNSHVIADITWPWKIKVVTPICLGPNILKTAGDTDRLCYNGARLENSTGGIKWSRARWRDVVTLLPARKATGCSPRTLFLV